MILNPEFAVEILSSMSHSNAVAALKCRELGGRAGLPSFNEALEFMAEEKRRVYCNA